MSARAAAGSGSASSGLRERLVEPEILDTLDPADPVALANRRDIRIINRLMGNFRWMGRALAALPARAAAVELAAGDGSLGLHLLRRGVFTPTDAYTGIDLVGRPAGWPEPWQWIRGNLLEQDLDGTSRILLANLILHQLEDAELRALGDRIRRSRIRHVLVSEPSRSRTSLWLLPLTRLLRMHPVTLHDARVSVRAGFRGGEIGRLLGLEADEWEIHYTTGRLGACRARFARR